jgi:hypothetical protein
MDQRAFGSGDHQVFVAIHGAGAVITSTITKYLQQTHFHAISPEPPDEPPMSLIDRAILYALDKQPFSSIRELAKLTDIPITTLH